MRLAKSGTVYQTVAHGAPPYAIGNVLETVLLVHSHTGEVQELDEYRWIRVTGVSQTTVAPSPLGAWNPLSWGVAWPRDPIPVWWAVEWELVDD